MPLPLSTNNNSDAVANANGTRLPARIITRRNAIRYEEVDVNNENSENKENIPEILGNISGEQTSS